MGQRLLVLEQRVYSAAQKEEVEQQYMPTDEATYAYSQALQMFEQGADANVVASNCGLSSSEANLMALMRKTIQREGEATEA